MMRQHTVRRCLLLCLALPLPVLVACGGGGGAPVAGTPAPGVPPVVTLEAPSLDAQPISGNAKAGSAYTLSVHATGSLPLSYQWFRAGVAVPGATSERLDLSQVAYSDDGAPYTVSVSNAAGERLSQEARIVVLPATTPVVITACREITKPGSYVLGGDIVGANQVMGACLQIHDTSDVQLDCANFSVAYSVSTTNTVLDVSKVRNFSVKNCRFDGNVANLTGVSAGVISQSSFVFSDPAVLTIINVFESTGVVLDRNNVTGGAVQAWHSDSTSLSNNVIASGTKAMAGSVVSNFGVHTRIFGNTISGGWDGKAANGLTGQRVGADDGIIISDERDVRVENNTIQNYWDCGIETYGFIQASTFAGNRVVRGEFCGIGGWYYSSLLGNRFINNTVEKSGSLFYFTHVFGLRAADSNGVHAQDTAVYFKDNVFDGNVVVDPASMTGLKNWAATIPVYDAMGYGGDLGGLPGETLVKASDFVLTNNTFKNNDFNAVQAYAAWFGDKPIVSGVVIDGGGNKCQLLTADKAYPLVCH